MNDLLLAIQNWYHKVCSKCSAPCKQRRLISSASYLLVFKFDEWDSTGKTRRKANINAIPSCSLKIGTCLYKPRQVYTMNKPKQQVSTMLVLCQLMESGYIATIKHYHLCNGQKVQKI